MIIVRETGLATLLGWVVMAGVALVRSTSPTSLCIQETERLMRVCRHTFISGQLYDFRRHWRTFAILHVHARLPSSTWLKHVTVKNQKA